MIINKPATGNFPAYASLYIDLIADDGHVITRLTDQLPSTLALLQSLPDSTLRHRYAQDKWSIKEILSHIIDDERIYVYRALRFARNDCTELPGFDQDQYVADSAADSRTGQEIIEEYAATRRASIAFFQGLNERQWAPSCATLLVMKCII